MRVACVSVVVAAIALACDKPKPPPPAPTLSPAPTPTPTPTPAPTPTPSVDIFAQPSASAPDPMAPYLQKPMLKITHVGPMQIEERSDKHPYARIPYHVEVLANGPPKAALAGRARCRIGEETMVDDGMRFDDLGRLAPGESMALYADFFSYPTIDVAPKRCTIAFSYLPKGRYEREPHAQLAAFCVDAEKVAEGECKE